MWNRVEMKELGKAAFKKNYWPSVLAAFAILYLSGITSQNGVEITKRLEPYVSYGMISLISKILIMGSIVAFIYIVFVGNVLQAGGCLFFIKNHSEKARIGVLLEMFHSENYLNVVKIQFLKNLKIYLWTLLLIVPGIIKTYEYAMVPYILAENPGMDSKEVFAISKKMMMGRKFDFFVMQLSFIGWQILSVLTLGVVGIFYVNPYMQATVAEIYASNKEAAYERGYIR